ncbi:MAG: hypothetical protein WCW84_06820 [Sulfurimonas sp.]|jgi:CheY-like chemotaxis protein
MKIALIDDQQSILNIYRTMLVKSGALADSELMTFSGIASYLDVYTLPLNTLSEKTIHERIASSVCPFDAVICDYNLGKDSINGYSFLFHLQEAGYVGLSILLTGDNSDEMKVRMEHAPTLYYVFKGSREKDKNPYVVLKQIFNNLRAEQVLKGAR